MRVIFLLKSVNVYRIFISFVWDDDVIDLKLLLEDGIELEIDLFILMLIEFLSKSMCHVQKVYSEVGVVVVVVCVV